MIPRPQYGSASQYPKCAVRAYTPSPGSKPIPPTASPATSIAQWVGTGAAATCANHQSAWASV